jgi:hypothetical protein
MNADQAWQAALNQLQLEMPKSTFETWVRDVELFGYEDGVFTLSTPNDYACQWLEGRLSSTCRRLLTGLMNRSVDVQFVVESLAENDGETPEIVETGDSQLAASDSDHAAHLELVHASLREAIIGPGIVPVPGYFRRWVPYLGSYLSWIYIAFRQVFFLSTGSKQINHTTFEVKPSAGAYWAGIDRKLFRQHMDDWMLGWFLEKDADKEHHYHFRLSMPLTPGDAEALLAWLLEANPDEPLSTEVALLEVWAQKICTAEETG